jgi:hypothetical protein
MSPEKQAASRTSPEARLDQYPPNQGKIISFADWIEKAANDPAKKAQRREKTGSTPESLAEKAQKRPADTASVEAKENQPSPKSEMVINLADYKAKKPMGEKPTEKEKIEKKTEKKAPVDIKKLRKQLARMPRIMEYPRRQPEKAHFRPAIRESLQRCGVQVDYVKQIPPLGMGEGYVVFLYQEPGKEERVLKIPLVRKITSMTQNRKEDEENYKVAKRAFGDYVPETVICPDPKDKSFYCILQEKKTGKQVTSAMMKDPEIRRQVKDIARRNRALYREKQMSLDFVGWNGFVQAAEKLLMKDKQLEADNMIVDTNGQVQLIDYETIRLSESTNIFRRGRDLLYLLGNKWFMFEYFNVWIAGPQTPSPYENPAYRDKKSLQSMLAYKEYKRNKQNNTNRWAA